MKKPTVLRTVFTLLPLSFIACETWAQEAAAPKVAVAAAYTDELVEEVVFIGKGEAVDKVDIVARVSGFVEGVMVKDGSVVKEGDLLFRIEPDTYEATLAARVADLNKAVATQDLTETELDRKEELFQRQVGTEADRDLAFANNQVAIAEVEIAQAAIRLAELDVTYTHVTAPFDGRIGRVNVSIGELVGPSSTPLVNLLRTSPIYVDFSLTERQFVNLLKVVETRASEISSSDGAPDVFVTLPNGDALDEVGRVVFADNRVDPTTGTVAFRAQFENEQGLIADGSFLGVRIQATQPSQVLLIPQAAVQRDQRGDFVLVVGQQQTVEQRYVTLGRQVETAVVVEDGMREGEAVIVEGLQRVRPGVAVDSVLSGTPAGE